MQLLPPHHKPLCCPCRSAKGNGELLVTPETYQQAIGTSNNTANSYFFYTINWQPTTVGWFVNDGTILVKKSGNNNTSDGVGARPER